ncbi:MAG TPA: roadblock/LC7 domain-containing protein [Planktothrix sp.]
MKEDTTTNVPPVFRWLVLLFKKKETLSDDRGAINERMRKIHAAPTREPGSDSILSRNKAKVEDFDKGDEQRSLAELIRQRLDETRVKPEESVAEINKEIAEQSKLAATVELSHARRWRSLRIKFEPSPTTMREFPALDPGFSQPSLPLDSPLEQQFDTAQPFGFPQPQVFASQEQAANMEQWMPAQNVREPLIDSRVIPVEEISNFLDVIFAEPQREMPVQRASETIAAGPTPFQVQQNTFGRLRADEAKEVKGGNITAIGPFLLDKTSERAVQNLITNASSRTRVLTEAEAGELKECLKPIEALDGVAGCIILGYDGLVIANTLPKHCDLDVFSSWALVTYMNSHSAVDFLGHGKVQQIVSRTIGGIMLLADFGQGLLLAVSDKTTTDAVLPLMRGVRKVTAA